jgi:hypothetical protein
MVRIILADVALGLLLCAIPRDDRSRYYGWPFIWIDLVVFTYTGSFTEEEVKAHIEESWQNGEIGPNGAHVGGGTFVFRIAYGEIIDLNVPRLLGNVLASTLTLAAAWTTMRLVRRRWDPRLREGHCRMCGYELTGNESGVCPECGAPMVSIDNAR